MRNHRINAHRRNNISSFHSTHLTSYSSHPIRRTHSII